MLTYPLVSRLPERRLLAGEIDAYELDLPSDTYLHVTFEQRGVDVAVEIFSPGRRRLMRVDSPNLAQGPEEIHLVTDVAGRYRLEVSAHPGSPTGTYQPILRALRRPSAVDRLQAATDLAFHEGRELDRHGAGFQEVAAKYERAVRLFAELGDRWHEAYTLFRLGKLHLGAVRYREALDLYTRAGELFQALHDDRFYGACRGESGTCYTGLADFDHAWSAYQEALALARGRGDLREQATLLHDLGNLEQLHGRSSEALHDFRAALALWERQGNPTRAAAANTLIGIGWVYSSLGDTPRAVDAQWRALRLRNRLGDKRQQAVALTQIGNALLADAPQRGLPFYERALALERAAGYVREESVTLVGIGLALRELERNAEARAADLEALKLYGTAPDPAGEAAAWVNLGWASAHLGRPEQALDSFARGLDLARQVRDPTVEARAVLGMAEAERERGNLLLAQARAEAALADLERLRTSIARPDLQASYLAANESVYEILVRILMERHRVEPRSGYAQAAWERSEQARARGLLDTLRASREAKAALEAGASPALLAQRRRLLDEIGAQDAQRRRPGVTAAELAAAQQALAERIEALNEVDAKIGHRARASLPSLRPLSDLRRELLGPDTVLLEYYVGAPKSYLWAVSADSIESFELPGRHVLEPAIRELSEEWAGLRAPTAGRDRAAKLGRLLLALVADRLPAHRRVLLATNGALQYLPFAALPDPTGPGPLLLRHEVIVIPSLAVLAELRARRAGRRRPPYTLALLGDPVFDPGDERLPPGRSSGAGVEPSDDFLPRLVSSRAEVEAIASLLPERERRVALDLAASRDLVTRGVLSRYRILHFATHGLLRTDHPELSSLVLSRFAPSGEPSDGYLRVPDIAGLDLPADLVVLSACSTGLGRETEGEGLVGLPQAFFAAGAQQVLVSLWQVEDASTAALMQRFYQRLLVDHLPPARALQDAQLAVCGQRRWSAPRYWAGFVLQGDWPPP